ncbi:MAG: EFR1 family ferrodoxin, partial [Candidatus Fimenecus sp.]
MILYFTATGNSLYVAKQLDKSPISIPQVKSSAAFKNDTIGIVCPVYCGEIPKAVLNFIKNSKFETDYMFLILTYGMDETDSAEFTFNQCQRQGVQFDYIACIKMVDNYLPAFDMAAEKKLDKQIPEQLSAIIKDIDGRKKG